MITLFQVCRGKKIEDKIIIITNEKEAVIDYETEIPATVLTKKKGKFNSYFVSCFMTTLINSVEYRILVTNFLHKYHHSNTQSFLQIKLDMYDGKHPIDYAWNNRITCLCCGKREMNTAMAWLSTLGGAFSALGDYRQDLASMAGRISVEQFKLALKLGDPPTVARCRLFYALSSIQRGNLKYAREIIQKTYQLAITKFPEDKRLRRMCLGIWTRLQFEWNNKRKRVR